MYYILSCPKRCYYIENRKGNLPNNIVVQCVNDPLGNPITEICCYDKDSLDKGIIKVDYKQWFKMKDNK